MCESELEGVLDGLVARGCELSFDGSLSATVIDASYMSLRRYLSTALSNISPMVSAVRTMTPVFNGTD